MSDPAARPIPEVEAPDELATRIAAVLAGLTERDAERCDPPADLWGRIAAAVTSEPANTPEGAPIGAGAVVEYAIDVNDVLVDLGEGWREFAAANEAPELAWAPAGRSLWSQIGDEELRDLWRTAVERVRRDGVVVTVPFRCDGPSARRWYEMTLTPQRNGGIHFRSVLTFEMSRPEVPLLQRAAPRDGGAPAIAVCSCCAEGLHGGAWVPVEELLSGLRLLEQVPAPKVSYGICPRCSSALSDRFATHGSATHGGTVDTTADTD